MIAIIVLALIFLFSSAGSAIQENIPIRFEKEEIHLGKVKRGDSRSMVFRFQNISQEKVEIDLVSSCECTRLEWTGEPVLPGQFGEIKAVFDSGLKDKSETVDVDVYLKNSDPETGNPYMIILNYTYELVL